MPAQVKPEDREKHSATGDGRFPIATKQQAISAIRLRGHAKSHAERMAILRRAAKFVPEMARKAMEEDRKGGK
jgi:hypothetical protein